MRHRAQYHLKPYTPPLKRAALRLGEQFKETSLVPACCLEGQWLIKGYFRSIMVYFGVYRPMILGCWAFQVVGVGAVWLGLAFCSIPYTVYHILYTMYYVPYNIYHVLYTMYYLPSYTLYHGLLGSEDPPIRSTKEEVRVAADLGPDPWLLSWNLVCFEWGF